MQALKVVYKRWKQLSRAYHAQVPIPCAIAHARRCARASLRPGASRPAPAARRSLASLGMTMGAGWRKGRGPCGAEQWGRTRETACTKAHSVYSAATRAANRASCMRSAGCPRGRTRESSCTKANPAQNVAGYASNRASCMRFAGCPLAARANPHARRPIPCSRRRILRQIALRACVSRGVRGTAHANPHARRPIPCSRRRILRRIALRACVLKRAQAQASAAEAPCKRAQARAPATEAPYKRASGQVSDFSRHSITVKL